MKNNLIWVVMALALAAGLTAVSVKYSRLANSRETEKSEKMDKFIDAEAAYNNILTRYSLRSYKKQDVPDSIVEKILRAGMSAPTAMDKRPWEFIVLRSEEERSPVSEGFGWSKMATEAPLVIIVCGNKERFIEDAPEYWVQDCSATSENILLAAHALGLGGVWCGVYPISERVDLLRKALELPDSVIPLNAICIGYPEVPGRVKEKWNPDNVHYGKY